MPTGGGNLAFTVNKDSGEPLAGIPVYLFTPGGSYLVENRVTDATGAVDFDLTDGSYKFRADYLGYQYWSNIYTVPGSVSEFLPIVHRDVTVNAGATYGTERLAIENAHSYVFTAAGAYQRINSATDTSGNVSFKLPDQAYKVRLDYLGQQYWSAEFTGADSKVDIPHCYVYVRVSDAGAAVQGARVYLFTEAGAYLSRYVETDAVGEAAFFIPEGAYKFRVDYDGQQYWSNMVNTIAHEDLDLPMALDLLARNKTNNPYPQRYDGQPPAYEPKPVYLASLLNLPGILAQSVVGATPQDAVYYFLNDHLGTPLIAVDENGAVAWEADYELFGGANVGTQTYVNNFRFAGQYYDQETGLNYNYHRYYYPETGRYLTPDPIGLAGGINLYAYVQNNPINAIDPWGLFSWGFGGTIGPITVSWDSSKPRKTNIALVSDLEIGGGFSFTFDHPFPESNPPKAPFFINGGISRWLGISTDGDKFRINLGLGVGLTPIDISKGKDTPESNCP